MDSLERLRMDNQLLRQEVRKAQCYICVISQNFLRLLRFLGVWYCMLRGNRSTDTYFSLPPPLHLRWRSGKRRIRSSEASCGSMASWQRVWSRSKKRDRMQCHFFLFLFFFNPTQTFLHPEFKIGFGKQEQTFMAKTHSILHGSSKPPVEIQMIVGHP